MTPLLLDIPKDLSTWIALLIAVGAVAFVMFRPKMLKKKDPLEYRRKLAFHQKVKSAADYGLPK